MTAAIPPQLDIITPVCNEGATIAEMLHEWNDELSRHISLNIIVVEDGSNDNTKDVLCGLIGELPLTLDMMRERRGYGSAVRRALSATRCAYVLAVDSDGQCDPRDFWPFWKHRDRFDVIIGWRVHRYDNFARRIMSRAFKLLHRALFHVPLHDPSCPYVLISRPLLDTLLPELGTLSEGFWWEFVARAAAHGARIGEVPIGHRLRAHGTTVVFKPVKIPRIAWQNGIGLLQIWRRSSGGGNAVVKTIDVK